MIAAIQGKEATEMQQLVDRAGGVRLRDILPTGRFFGANDIFVQSCSNDWQKCGPGDAYVALMDADGDGHDYVDQAVERGAGILLANHNAPVLKEVARPELERTVERALRRVCEEPAVRCLPLHRALMATGSPDVFQLDQHWSAQGNRVVAETLRAALTESRDP